MTLKEYVISKVNPDEYYAKRFPEWNPRAKSNVRCPFHEDGANGNLAIGLRNGGARCHSTRCAKRIGNIVHFEATRTGEKEPIAARRIYREFVRPVVDAKLLAIYRQNLRENTAFILKIKKEMGLTSESIDRFQLGLDTLSNRITIPVYDQFKQAVNVRFYRLPSQRNGKDNAKIHNLPGFGGADLFPWPATTSFTDGYPVFIMASEKEAMLALQDGYNAFASTAGEDKWDPEWDSVVANRRVFTVLDVDEGGEAARRRLVPLIEKAAKSVTNILLPFRTKRKDWKDYADFRLKEKRNGSELGRLAKKYGPKSVPKSGSNGSTPHPPVDDEGEVTCSEGEVDYPELPPFATKKMMEVAHISSRSDLLNKRIKTQGIVAAKSPNTFSIPWKFKVKIKSRPDFEYELPMSRELLRYVRSSDTQILQSVQKIIGNNNAEVLPIAYLTATEVEIIPTASIDQDATYVIQRCFYFGKKIESNVPYYFEIIPTSEIRSQETIGIITKITPLSKSIERFDASPENIADLYAFRPSDGESVWDKMESLATQVTERFTHIYNRLDWTLMALLTWSSPIGWWFPNEPHTDKCQRGWINTLTVGDTETGKSKVSLALKALFKCGVFMSGENCTFVGLVGGAIKMGSGQLMLRWGRIPLCDKQLVVIEELSGLSVEEISNMSDVRSSGVARLDKGGISAETNSRTRLICLSNPRSIKKPLSSYLFGIHAVQELIGHGEDIARFDLITTLTDNEVSINVINSAQFASSAKDEYIGADQFQKLIHFVWALTPEQIEFEQKAYEECLEQTKRLSAIYHSSIPIFKGGSGRYKLGRIAAAIACLQFAWDESKGKVIVTSKHVKAAGRLLDLLYTKPSLGYSQYSSQMYDRERVKDVVLVRKGFKDKIPRSTLPKVLETLVHSTRFSRDELCAIAGMTLMHADQLIGVMMRERVLRKGEGNLWDITPAGKRFLEDFIERLSK
jgi:hypothetical protein